MVIHDILPVCIGPCPPSWIANADHCYHIVKNIKPIPRDGASKICKRDSATLASITSENEQHFLEKYRDDQGFEHNDMWIGGQKKDGTWKWDDGSSFSYENWADGQEPTFGSCNILLTSDRYNKIDNKWYAISCTNSHYSLVACKKIRKIPLIGNSNGKNS